jgi:hypothetical protein
MGTPVDEFVKYLVEDGLDDSTIISFVRELEADRDKKKQELKNIMGLISGQEGLTAIFRCVMRGLDFDPLDLEKKSV